MSNNSKHLTQQDILSTQMSAEEDQNSMKSGEQLITQEAIEHTPFTVIGNSEKGYFLAFGEYRMTEAKASIEEAKEELEVKRWNIMANLACIIFEKMSALAKVNNMS